jgi:hypothetical protein
MEADDGLAGDLVQPEIRKRESAVGDGRREA